MSNSEEAVVDSATTSGARSLAPGLLIAVPAMQDPFFARSVVLLIEHDDEGAFGVVLNRKAPVDLKSLLSGAGLDSAKIQGETPVWWGGPVQPESGMVLYRNEARLARYEPDHDVHEDLRCSWSMELLQDIAAGKGPATFSLFLGRAAWGPGQLESELETGAWIPADSDDSLLFTDEQAECWRMALLNIGAAPGNVAPGEPAQA